jgi:thymidylate kinase
MNPKNKFILFEGMDLSGKSTLLQLVKQTDIWSTQHIGLNQDKSIYATANYINRYSKDWGPKEVGYLYLAALTIDINNFTWPDSPTLQDSCVLLRALAHHSAYKNNEIVKKLEMLSEAHPKFSKSFVLTVSPVERLRRLKERIATKSLQVNNSDFLIKNNPELFNKMNHAMIFYAKKYFNAEVVDTTSSTLENTLEFVLKSI